MPARKPCAVCGHLERAAIEAALRGHAMSLRAIIRTYGGMNLGGLSRHRDRHMDGTAAPPLSPHPRPASGA